jgi:hypothetical protein
MFLLALVASTAAFLPPDPGRFEQPAPSVEGARNVRTGWGSEWNYVWKRTDIYSRRLEQGSVVVVFRREENGRDSPRWADSASCPAATGVIEDLRKLNFSLQPELDPRPMDYIDNGRAYAWGPAHDGPGYMRVSAMHGPLPDFASAADDRLRACWTDTRPF